MKVTFGPRGILQIDNARIKWRNFEGREEQYNRAGDRNFALVIDDQDIADALMEDKNEYGVGWNVKIKAPREDGDTPLMHLPVKVKFTNRGPNCYLITNGRRVRLDEDSVAALDNIYISNVDLDIRPYDDIFNGKAFRTAYLHSIEVTQELDRFEARYAEEEYPGEDVF